VVQGARVVLLKDLLPQLGHLLLHTLPVEQKGWGAANKVNLVPKLLQFPKRPRSFTCHTEVNPAVKGKSSAPWPVATHITVRPHGFCEKIPSRRN
jgi:hypothetical protein